jgi:hypothetical protein
MISKVHCGFGSTTEDFDMSFSEELWATESTVCAIEVALRDGIVGETARPSYEFSIERIWEIGSTDYLN